MRSLLLLTFFALGCRQLKVLPFLLHLLLDLEMSQHEDTNTLVRLQARRTSFGLCSLLVVGKPLRYGALAGVGEGPLLDQWREGEGREKPLLSRAQFPTVESAAGSQKEPAAESSSFHRVRVSVKPTGATKCALFADSSQDEDERGQMRGSSHAERGF